jgi:hypothetical protein
VQWDLAWNTQGRERATRELQLINHNSQDDVAWLAGIVLG